MSSFLDGDLAADQAAGIEEHLALCAACAADAAGLRGIVAAAAALGRAIEPDRDLWPAIEARIAGEARVDTAGRAAPERRTHALAGWLGLGRGAGAFAWRGGLVAAAVLAIAVFGEWRFGGLSKRTAWEVVRLEGAPVLGARGLAGSGRLRTGEWLQTDLQSRARLTADDVGRVDVGPGSALRLVDASEHGHRIELARGEVNAFIWAPPRLFFVETASGVAEDLGCQYHLVVDRAGNGALEVTLGFVSFERDGREVIVPAGARCELRAGVGPGTPRVFGAPETFCSALSRFDFNGDGDAGALETVLDAAREKDAVTLWHLLPRTSESDRARVVDRLIELVALPRGVTRDGVLALDARMLDRWWAAICPGWSVWQL